MYTNRERLNRFGAGRGALRNGMCRDEVEEIQQAVEDVCWECGMDGLGDEMPRVGDIEVQEGEGSRKVRVCAYSSVAALLTFRSFPQPHGRCRCTAPRVLTPTKSCRRYLG